MLATLPLVSSTFSAQLPEGYWPRDRRQAILDKTENIRLAPDLSDLTAGERKAVEELLAVGRIMQRLYEDSRHPQAIESFKALQALHASTGRSTDTTELVDLYRLFKGPVATTLDNTRVAFLPVSAETPTRNVYPADATRAEIDAFVEKYPGDRDDILATRTVVRRITKDSLSHDLETLKRHPELDVLHSFFKEKLASLAQRSELSGFYAVPQSVRWATEITEASRRLHVAARHVETDDPEFARYLRNRARDLLSDDYESGDAAWVTGRFRGLNAMIGSYETYDDPLYGAKAFMAVSLLKRSQEASRKLREAITGLQGIEDSLPYDHHRRVREDMPVGVYEVIADFGQARGTNTATILPNDALFTRRYGRTILLRENVMRHPVPFKKSKAAWDSVVVPQLAADLTEDGNFNRTLWHEIGHYLGVDRDRSGRALDVALGPAADAFEEMKSDLVSLFAAPALRKSGFYDDTALRSVCASGILRTLQDVKPRRDQPYQTMQLMQFNWFVDKGLVEVDRTSGRLIVHYEGYHDAVASLLSAVLRIQHEGDQQAAEAFMDRWTTWQPTPHDAIAKTMRAAAPFIYVTVKYGVLDD